MKTPGRPPLPPGERRRDVNLRLHPLCLAQLDELTAQTGQPRARLIERAVAELHIQLTEQ